MDIQTPEIDRIEATRAIRKTENKDIRKTTIATAAHALEGDRKRCLEAGMDDCISKPLNHDELISLIKEWSG